jgi:hypothetical protein
MNQAIFSEWHCRSCTQVFNTRGKRDAHYRREHQIVTTVKTQSGGKNMIKRSENGNFKCVCGNNYMLATSLKRHQKGCDLTADTLGVEMIEG